MNRTTFKAACTALWGPQYRSEAARQLKVHLRTLMRWDTGDTKVIPQAVDDQLYGLLIKRHAEVGKLIGKIKETRS